MAGLDGLLGDMVTVLVAWALIGLPLVVGGIILGQRQAD
jgi:hypothetical protein